MFLANFWVISLTEGRTFKKISKIPTQKCALVLGTSPKTREGRANPYFISRLEAVMALYNLGKIKRIIVSGEKSRNYDEPHAMKNYLIYNGGIPEYSIIEDPGGFNTQTSISRCKYIYQEHNIIIVSQRFHNVRALFIARKEKMNAYAFDAKDINAKESFYRNHAREFLARVKAVVLYILNISPHISGDKINIE
ncbi:SanA protein [Elizabethkingia argentiflava]|uniref:SanA protein n=1 Tax=Elizabethkingia argenteiflava TaxID=2681556 RepID=A0A845PS22_9FLAO|nr:ElyC/SanA/YdcF family protein [Elizabethkingia argenteiflava]NAW51012.1 SanA protein [Elizabethkingia argenteiflava]